MSTIIKFVANNDINGNGRRVYVLFNESNTMIAAWPENDMGDIAVPGALRERAYNAPVVDVTVKEYKRLIKLPFYSYINEVPGYHNYCYN